MLVSKEHQCIEPHNLAARLTRAWSRYGLRSAPVGLARARLSLERNIGYIRAATLCLTCRGHVGKRAVLMGGCIITPGARIEIGNDVYIGRGSSLEISDAPGFPPVPTRIGDHTWIS